MHFKSMSAKNKITLSNLKGFNFILALSLS